MKNFKHYWVIILFVANVCSAQTAISYDFSNNDLSQWSGTTSHFIVNSSHQLQLNNTVASSSYLATTFAPDASELEWSVYVRQTFAGSGSNYGRIYLSSSQANLTQATEGYYLQLGEAGSSDAVELFRQSGMTAVSVCRAANGTIASSFAIRMKVTRSGAGLWKVLIDYNGGSDFAEAASGVDNNYPIGGYMGMLCVYTVGNATRFYYDDIYAGPPKPIAPPPDVAAFNDVVINEFFPDPSPSVGLPEQEFAEIYNRSSKTFDLNGWKIGDATTLVAMPSVVIHPDEYVVITTSDGLPSLNNGGDVVKIIDNHGALIDSISYNLNWYHDGSKSGGGYSIERLNPEKGSNDVSNWYVSQSLTGGTPGARNSVFTNFVAHDVNYKDVVITEVMADPAPVVQLPEAEYVELLNRSSNPVSFSGWYLEDPTTRAQLPPLILNPGDYLLLTSTTNASRFSKAVGVSSFPSLGNLGDRIVLRAPNGIAIDSIAYTTSWYHDSEKSDGGWSLELIDVNNPCGEIDNWTASEDIDGGTPGEINSVYANKPDVTAPNVLSVTAISPDTLSIVFDEKLSDAGEISLGGISTLRYNEIVHVLSESLQTRTLYSISISGVADCTGNRMDNVTLTFALPESASANDVVINEVLFNPRPNGVDFVEVYNRSEKYINLERWKITDKIITESNDVLLPKSYRVFTSSIVATQTNYPVASFITEMAMPSLPDDEGVIMLVDNRGNIIDQFSYNDDMHSSILSDDEGVSLERISSEDVTNDRSNWHSANASAGYATPGYLNSNSRVAVESELGKISVSPEVIHRSGSASFSQILYRFDHGGLVANVSVIDLEGRLIKTVASNATLGVEGSFQWDGDRDGGGLARGGYYLVWFQVFDLDGEVKTYRKRVVVGL